MALRNGKMTLAFGSPASAGCPCLKSFSLMLMAMVRKPQGKRVIECKDMEVEHRVAPLYVMDPHPPEPRIQRLGRAALAVGVTSTTSRHEFGAQCRERRHAGSAAQGDDLRCSASPSRLKPITGSSSSKRGASWPVVSAKVLASPSSQNLFVNTK